MNEVNEIKITTKSPEETELLGKIMGDCISPPIVLALFGELASGKTCFVKGVVKSICGETWWVHSPTFTLINQYGNTKRVIHVDCYRVKDINELLSIGIEEYLEGEFFCIIEWAEKLQEILPSSSIKIYFAHISENLREIRIKGLPKSLIQLITKTLEDKNFELL